MGFGGSYKGGRAPHGPGSHGGGTVYLPTTTSYHKKTRVLPTAISPVSENRLYGNAWFFKPPLES